MARHPRNGARWRGQRRASLWLAAGLGALALAGCEVNTDPQVPSWDTQVNFPLVNQVKTMSELLDGSTVLIASEAGGLLAFEVSDTLSDATVGTLDIDDMNGSFDDSLGVFAVRDPGSQNATLQFVDLWPPAAGLDGSTAPVPAYSFTDVKSNIADFGTFTSATLASGSLVVTVVNGTPAPLQLTELRVEDRVSGLPVVSVAFPADIAPGDTAVQNADLAGAVLSNQLRAALTGGSPGSGGAVFIDAQSVFQVTAAFANLQASAATAQLPATAFGFTDQIDLSQEMTLTTATLAGGTLVVDFDSDLPVGAQVDLALPELTAGGVPLALTLAVPAGGTRNQSVDLTGYLLAPAPPDGLGVQHVGVQADVTTNDSGGTSVGVLAGDQMHVQASIQGIVMQEVEGILQPQIVDVDADTTSFDIPEDLEGVGLSQASLLLEIETSIDFPMDLDLVASGRDKDGVEVLLPIQASFPAGSGAPQRTLTLALDETNSDLLPFMNALPREIAVGGEVTVGDGSASSTLRQDDWLRASYRINTPLRLTLAEQTLDPETDKLVEIEPEGGGGGGDGALSGDVTDRMIEGALIVQVRNHLPFGVDLTFKMAEDSASVVTSPQVVVGPLTIGAGSVNVATGLVDEVSVTSSELALTSEDLDIFKLNGAPGKQVYGGVEIHLHGTAGQAVGVRASDYLEISVLAHLRAETNFGSD